MTERASVSISVAGIHSDHAPPPSPLVLLQDWRIRDYRDKQRNGLSPYRFSSSRCRSSALFLFSSSSSRSHSSILISARLSGVSDVVVAKRSNAIATLMTFSHRPCARKRGRGRSSLVVSPRRVFPRERTVRRGAIKSRFFTRFISDGSALNAESLAVRWLMISRIDAVEVLTSVGRERASGARAKPDTRAT